PTRRWGDTDGDEAKARQHLGVSIRTPPEGGVIPGRTRYVSDAELVSIRTPPEGGVIPTLETVRVPPIFCFNPHPTRRWGDTSRHSRHRQGDRLVSIRTPPEGGVIRSKGQIEPTPR